LQELVAQVPAPLVADMLGYSDQVTQKHAAEAGNIWAAYASTAPKRSSAIPPDRQRQSVPDTAHAETGDQLTLDIIDENIDEADSPASPFHAHIDALGDAANAVAQARAAVAAAEDELAQAVLRAHQSGLSWVKIAATLGMSRPAGLSAVGSAGPQPRRARPVGERSRHAGSVTSLAFAQVRSDRPTWPSHAQLT
jgi:hypothetical protein